MDIRIAQLAVGRDLDANLARILDVIDDARPGELVVFPEGMLSGYDPSDDGYSDALDAGAIDRAVARVRDRAAQALRPQRRPTPLRGDAARPVRMATALVCVVSSCRRLTRPR